MPIQVNDVSRDSITIKVTNLRIDNPLTTLTNLLQNCESLMSIEVERNHIGLSTGSAFCSFKPAVSLTEIRSLFAGLVDASDVQVEEAEESKVPTREAPNIIQQSLNKFSDVELRSLIYQIRMCVLYHAVPTRKLLIENPHLALAVLYVFQRVKPSIFHYCTIPKEAFIQSGVVDDFSRKRSIHESDSQGSGAISTELGRMIRAMTPQQLKKVEKLTSQELHKMPLEQRTHMVNIQRYLLEKNHVTM